MDMLLVLLAVGALSAIGLVPTWLLGRWGVARRRRLSRDNRRMLLTNMPVTVLTTRSFPADMDVAAGVTMVEGSCVISPDAWQGFLAGFTKFFGGSITSHADGWRLAREVAVSRLTSDAARMGYNCVVNVRIQQINFNHHDTSKGKGAFAVMAYGTACRTVS